MSVFWIVNCDAATMAEGTDPYGLIKDAAILVRNGQINWVGSRSAARMEPREAIVDAGGGILFPGLIDCHTHLVYGGTRSGEFEERLSGKSYGEISAAGGGIHSTVRSTRAASIEDLAREAAARLAHLVREGVTTVEIKSGYGLCTAAETRMIEAMEALERISGISVVKTFLGAHTLPAEFEGAREAYLKLVCEEMIPAVASRVDAVDVFCERIAFTVQESERVLQSAKDKGLAIKIHAEQLSDSGGTAMAARLGALSADHLEYLDEKGVEALARSGGVAVLLPGAFYTLRESQVPPVSLLRTYRVPMALATDSNPGSSPCLSLLLMLNMACTLFALTPPEALCGVTRNAARALGLQDKIGTIEPGKVADLALYDVRSPVDLVYNFGWNPCRLVWKRGKKHWAAK